MRYPLLKISVLALIAISCTRKPSLVWYEGIPDPETGVAMNELVLRNAPEGTDWDIWGHFYDSVKLPAYSDESSEFEMHHFQGSCYKLSPRFSGDSLVLRYYDYPRQTSWAPRGFYLKKKNNSDKQVAIPVEHHWQPFDTLALPGYKAARLSVTDIIPSVKKISPLVGTSQIDRSIATYSVDSTIRPEGYRLTIKEGKVEIAFSDDAGRFYAGVTLEKFLENAGEDRLPDMVVEDWPDFEYRAQMLDPARMFLTPDEVKRFIDVMARCKLNVLSLHLTDDQAWRLEIEGIPDLTEVGAHQMLPTRRAGFYSIKEYQDILKYAAERHIKVVPELDIPGHCYAACLSMKSYEKRTGDASMRLTSPGDSSVYESVQGFSENVIDIALPSTYNWLGKVYDSVIKTYEGAGLVCPEIVVGGDEVAPGAWTGSPACIAMMDENGWDVHGLREYFINRVMDLLEERGVKMSGYHDVALDISDATITRMASLSAHIWGWETYSETGCREARNLEAKGLPMILETPDFCNMDEAYSLSRNEHGLLWAGPIDERKAYSYDPRSILPGAMGFPAMMWGDNYWNIEDYARNMFPKVFGLYERSWNADLPEEDFETAFGRHYSIVLRQEMPFIESLGLAHRPALEEESERSGEQYPMFWTWMEDREGLDLDSLFVSMDEAGIDGLMLYLPDMNGYRKAARLAKEHGITLYAWIWTLRPRGDRDYLVENHPEWFDVNVEGKSLLDYNAYIDSYKFLSAAVPEVREYVRENVRRVCEIDGIEGICLDYCRVVDGVLPISLAYKYGIAQDGEVWPEYNLGFHPAAVSRFIAEYGYDPRTVEDPSRDEKWMSFRAGLITEVANYAAETAHSYGKKVAASPFSSTGIASFMVGQDFSKWNLDLVFPMEYSFFYSMEPGFVYDATVQNAATVPSATSLYCGIDAELGGSLDDLLESMDAAFRGGAQGVSLYTVYGLDTPSKRAAFKSYADSLRTVRSGNGGRMPRLQAPSYATSASDLCNPLKHTRMMALVRRSIQRLVAGESLHSPTSVNGFVPESGSAVYPDLNLSRFSLVSSNERILKYEVTDKASGKKFQVLFPVYGGIVSGWDVRQQ